MANRRRQLVRLVSRSVLLALAAVALPATASAAIVVGNQAMEAAVDYNAAGLAEAFRTTASAAGTVTSVSVYVDATSQATTLVAGVYSDSAGHPGTLLAQGSLASPAVGSWSVVPISTASVVAGGTYWIAILSPSGSGVLRFRDRCCGGGLPIELSSQTSLSALPAAWSTGGAYNDGPISAYGLTVDGPLLTVSPSSLSFAAAEGSAAPPGQQLAVGNGGGVLDWQVTTTDAWITVLPSSGVGPATVTVVTTPSGLAPGSYSGSVTVTAAGAQGSPKTLNVNLTVNVVDLVAPDVTISAPSSGATVSGPTAVAATASDNVGVAGVQFRLDGANLGAEDTTAPYSISWDTTTASNGTHTLTAVARDAAGNTNTSTAFSVAVANSAPPPSAGLVGAWAFNEGSGAAVTDASGNGNAGTITGATRTTSGKYGGALSFDGTSNYVAVPDASSLDLAGTMTLEAWVYPTTLGSAWRTAILKETPSYFTYALYANTNTARPSGHVYIGGDVETRGSAALTLNAWSHLAATYDGSTLRLYVNGTQVASKAVSGSMANSSGALKIGGNAVWGEWFAGRIDEVRVYNRALSAGEITTDLNTAIGVPPSGDTTPPTVSITAPVAGATVSGTTAVTASAADNSGTVSSVQFRLDGNALGAADTVAPFLVSWDTATASNGAHTLTAVATDPSGNQTTSTSIGVTSSNGPALDQVGRWDGPFGWPLVAVHGALLPTGNVLSFDAWDDAPNSERIWNPSNGTFVPVPYSRNLFCGGHTTLADGRQIVIGGHVAAYQGLKDTSLFNATTNTWTRGADMAVTRWYPTATALPDGKVLAFSGDGIVENRPGQAPALTDASVNSLPEVYDPVANTWTGLTGARLTTPLYPFMFVLSDGRIFDAGPDTTTRILNPATWTWSVLGTSPVSGHSAVMYRPNKIMKSGTWSDPDYYGSSVYNADGRTAVIDMSQSSPAWRETPPMAYARTYHNLTLLPDGTVLATGGSTNSDGTDLSKSVYAAEIWNPATETWRSVASEQVGRQYHSTALLLPDGRVLMAGGGRLPGRSTDQLNAEIYSPPYLFKGARPAITSAPSLVQYGSSFTVTTPDAARIASVSLIRTPSVTHAFDENQRFQFLNFTAGSGSLNVQAPASANLAPPGYYMLFLVDTTGVPSVASLLRFPAGYEDTESPTAPGSLAATGSTGSVSLSWTASNDNIAVARYNVHRSTTAGFTPSLANRVGQSTGLSYTDSGLAAGTYYYVVRAEDAAGNLSPSSNEASATITASDTTPPTVSLTAPAGGATVSGTISVTANAADNSGTTASVQFRLDGNDLGVPDTIAPFSASWNTTQVANGSHTLTAVAKDPSNNTTTSNPVTVTVTNSAPPPTVFLVGEQAIRASSDSNAPGVAEAFRASATTTGTLTKISVYVDSGSTAAGLVAGVYTNVNNHPGTLLAQGTKTSPTAGAWNDLTVPSATIASGTVYWIAVLAPTGTLRFRDACCGGGTPAETNAIQGLTALPATWSPGTVYNDGPGSVYGSGTTP